MGISVPAGMSSVAKTPFPLPGALFTSRPGHIKPGPSSTGCSMYDVSNFLFPCFLASSFSSTDIGILRRRGALSIYLYI